VFVDESGFAVDMPRRYGYAPQGQRSMGCWNWHEKGRENVIGALLNKTILTVGIFSCSITADVFQAWLTQDLIPKLPPGSVVVMDNAPFHKMPHTAKLLQQAGHTLLPLPTYSPDLNPIEHTWNEKKEQRRATQCSIDQLFCTIT